MDSFQTSVEQGAGAGLTINDVSMPARGSDTHVRSARHA